MMLTTRPLGTQGLLRVRARPRLHGDEPVLRHRRGARRARVDRHHPPGHRARRDLLRHGRGVRARTRTKSCWPAPSRAGATASSSPPSSASRSTKRRRSPASTAGRSTSARSSRLAAPPRHRPHRPALPAPRGPRRADRGDGGRDGRAGARGQGPLPRPLRGGRADDPARARRAPRSRRCRASTRCGSATSSRASSRCCASWSIGLVPFAPLGRGFLTGAVKRAEEYAESDYRRNDPRYQGENFDANVRAGVGGARAGARRSASPRGRSRSAWLLHKGPTSCPSRAPSGGSYLRGERRSRGRLGSSPEEMAALGRGARAGEGVRTALQRQSRWRAWIGRPRAPRNEAGAASSGRAASGVERDRVYGTARHAAVLPDLGPDADRGHLRGVSSSTWSWLPYPGCSASRCRPPSAGRT